VQPRPPDVIDVEGPITAEVFVVTQLDGVLLLTGPDGPQPWLIQAVDAGHPMALVDALVRRHLPSATLVHSTSWRYEADAVVLSFVAVVPAVAVSHLACVPVPRTPLARGSAHEAPGSIGWQAVLEHGLRHLAWLVRDDEAVAAALDPTWHDLLGDYVPEPFQHLGGPP
jgi:hypothetical protein